MVIIYVYKNLANINQQISKRKSAVTLLKNKYIADEKYPSIYILNWKILILFLKNNILKIR